MKRRTFIKGAVAAAVSAALPATAAATEYTHKTFAIGTNSGARYAAALARSMMQTREAVAANVFNRAFGPMVGVNELHYGVSGEGARRSVGVEGSPDRI